MNSGADGKCALEVLKIRFVFRRVNKNKHIAASSYLCQKYTS